MALCTQLFFQTALSGILFISVKTVVLNQLFLNKTALIVRFKLHKANYHLVKTRR